MTGVGQEQQHTDLRKVSLCEWTDGKWVLYGDYTSAVSWPSYLPKPAGNFVQQLSKGTLAYDYAVQDEKIRFRMIELELLTASWQRCAQFSMRAGARAWKLF